MLPLSPVEHKNTFFLFVHTMGSSFVLDCICHLYIQHFVSRDRVNILRIMSSTGSSCKVAFKSAAPWIKMSSPVEDLD